MIRNDGVAKLVAFEPADPARSMLAVWLSQLGKGTAGTNAQSADREPVVFAQAMRSLGATLYEATTGMAWVDPGPPPPSTQ